MKDHTYAKRPGEELGDNLGKDILEHGLGDAKEDGTGLCPGEAVLQEGKTFSSLAEVSEFMEGYMTKSKAAFIKSSSNSRQVGPPTRNCSYF